MTMRVLVVEDEADLRMLMRIHLERAGHEVSEASDGAIALDWLRRQDPDVVVLDLRMPHIDGWEVLETLAAEGRLIDLPVIVVSAYTGAEIKDRVLALGGKGYLSKPFGRPELLQLIDDVATAS